MHYYRVTIGVRGKIFAVYMVQAPDKKSAGMTGVKMYRDHCGIAGFSCIPRVEEVKFSPGDKKPVLSF